MDDSDMSYEELQARWAEGEPVDIGRTDPRLLQLLERIAIAVEGLAPKPVTVSLGGLLTEDEARMLNMLAASVRH